MMSLILLAAGCPRAPVVQFFLVGLRQTISLNYKNYIIPYLLLTHLLPKRGFSEWWNPLQHSKVVVSVTISPFSSFLDDENTHGLNECVLCES